MKVVWSELARDSLLIISDYILLEFGISAQDHFLDEVEHTAMLLELNPFIGKQEPLLEGLRGDFRSLVVSKLSKIVYSIQGNSVYIVDFWDTRIDPTALVERIF